MTTFGQSFLFKLDFQEKYLVSFTPFPTKLGRCMTFNMELNDKLFNNTRSGFQFRYGRRFEVFNLFIERDELKPRQVLFHTSHKDLGFQMNIFEGSNKFYLEPPNENLGFKVMVHSPYEIPDDALHYYSLSLNHSYILLVQPQLKTIDDSLIRMSPEE